MAMLLCFVSPAFAQKAKIGDAEYATLSAAISAATSGGTVTLIDNVNESLTVSKSVTIDGAGKTYTGTMTAAVGLTLTVQNVNFYDGAFVKNKSNTGTYTFKNCTFDGADRKQGYAVTLKGAKKLVVNSNGEEKITE